MVLLILSAIGLIIGSIIILLSSNVNCKCDDWVFFIGLFLYMISGTSLIVCGIYEGNQNNKIKPKEYSASQYSFDIKVTEFQGVKDTIYVLIPKEQEEKK